MLTFTWNFLSIISKWFLAQQTNLVCQILLVAIFQNPYDIQMQFDQKLYIIICIQIMISSPKTRGVFTNQNDMKSNVLQI